MPKHKTILYVCGPNTIYKFLNLYFLCMVMHNKYDVLKQYIRVIEIYWRRDEYSVISRFIFFVGLKKTLTRYGIINLLILSFFYLVII